MRTVALLIACIAAAAAPFLWGARPRPAQDARFPGWPAELDGRSLAALPLTAKEARLARDEPGRIGRFTDGEAQVVLRWIPSVGVSFHGAADCYRGLGFSVSPEPGWRDERGRLWGRFRAERDGERLVVRERVFDAGGSSWSDVSAWYWAALFGRSAGPWWAAMVVERRGSGGRSESVAQRVESR